MTDENGAELRQELGVFFWAVVWICAAIEATLFAGDLGLFGLPDLRRTVFADGAFWPGVLKNWKPNFPLQPAAMFVTYGFLHAGPVHLIVNMLAVISLAPAVVRQVGNLRAVLIYIASLIGGAAGYAILSSGPQPMVGASGAIFGLIGAVLAWDYAARRVDGRSQWPVIRAIGLLALLNIALHVLLGGRLAWEAHLGGFLAGAAAAPFTKPKNLHPR